MTMTAETKKGKGKGRVTYSAS